MNSLMGEKFVPESVAENGEALSNRLDFILDIIDAYERSIEKCKKTTENNYTACIVDVISGISLALEIIEKKETASNKGDGELLELARVHHGNIMRLKEIRDSMLFKSREEMKNEDEIEEYKFFSAEFKEEMDKLKEDILNIKLKFKNGR